MKIRFKIRLQQRAEKAKILRYLRSRLAVSKVLNTKIRLMGTKADMMLPNTEADQARLAGSGIWYITNKRSSPKAMAAPATVSDTILSKVVAILVRGGTSSLALM